MLAAEDDGFARPRKRPDGVEHGGDNRDTVGN
jgi:hypothetical protein